jgi:hypothetical protein
LFREYSIKDIITTQHDSLMKTTYTIAAIAMFAVILGMGALAPAMASKPIAGEDHKIEFCHYQEAKPEVIDTDVDSETFGKVLEEAVPEAYVVIETDKKGKMNGHFKNGDAHHFPVDDNGEATGEQGDFIFADEDLADVNDSEADCLALDAALNTDSTVEPPVEP